VLLDLDEAGVRHPGEVVVGAVAAHGAAEGARGFAEELAPAHEVGAVGCAVRALNGEAVVLDFEPAAGFEVSGGVVLASARLGGWYCLLVCLAEEGRPVGEAAGHQSGMDVVELSLVEPEIFCVIDNESTVRRHTADDVSCCGDGERQSCHPQIWLARTQIDARDLAIRKLIRYIYASVWSA